MGIARWCNVWPPFRLQELMATFSLVFKDEVSRLARKATRDMIDPVRSSATSSRHQIAQMKKEIAAMRKEMAALRRVVAKVPAPATTTVSGRKVRFTAKGFAALRAKLGLTREEMAKLLDCSAGSIYGWEHETQPRQDQVVAIAALRKLGKREARARLAA